MKNTRRFASVATAALLAACVAVPMTSAFSASAAGTGSITITDNSGATSSSMAAFQIFTAEVKGDSVVINGWGDGIDVETLGSKIATSSLKDDFEGVAFAKTSASAQKVSDIVSTFKGDNASKAEAFAKIACQCRTGAGTVAGEGGKITNLATGYYIVVDTEAASNGNYSAFTLGMLTVVTGENTNATVKRDFPAFDKQIGDINDTNDAAGTYTYNEAADHDMGDNVPFKLIATVPGNIEKYDTYKMIFHDDIQENVFSFNEASVKVLYYAPSSTNGVDVTAAFNYADADTKDEKFEGGKADGTEDFTLTCTDIKRIKINEGKVEAGGRFEVEYTAKLTDKANMGAAGNWNGAYLEYSNNPNVSGEGDTDNTGKSPTDYVVAFTYQTVIDKIDGITNSPLSGAEFKLTKKLKDGTEKTITAVKTDSDTRFVFNGLDDGEYTLEETAPEGYNSIDPITFTITADETQTDGSEALKSLSASSSSSGTTFASENVYIIDADKKEATNENGAANGSVKATIANFKGSSLPSTGGIGTTIFYVAGGILVAGAGVTLIAKKRMSKKEEA